jgi:protein TonB
MQAGVKLGPQTNYYETGELLSKIDYVGNKRNGEFVVFYKDGKVKRREKYQNDIRTGAECFGPNGSPIAYFDYEVMPSYRNGGLQNMVAAIQKQVRYPADALRNQIQGKVFVSFAVNPAGELQDVKIVKGLSASLDAEVLRAVNTLHGFTPGMQDGVPVTVSFTAPITFAIR